MPPACRFRVFVLLVGSAWVCARGASAQQPDTSVGGADQGAEETGYEPDQRGAIENEDEAGETGKGREARAGAAAQAGREPAARRARGRAELSGVLDTLTEQDDQHPWEQEEAAAAPPSIDATHELTGSDGDGDRTGYLRLRLSYGLLDPAAPEAGDLIGDGEASAIHGLGLGLAVGIHVMPQLDLGLLVEHGLYENGTGRTTTLLDAGIVFAKRGVIPRLRLGLGYSWVSALQHASSGRALEADGFTAELGMAVHGFLSEHWSLGGGVDVGALWLTRQAVPDCAAASSGCGDLLSEGSGTGLYLRLLLEAGWHF